MRHPLRSLLLSVAIPILVTTTGFYCAAEPAPEVRTYTNADLEALEPLPSQSDVADLPAFDEAGWDFVIAFIERERALIEAERERASEQRVAEVEADHRDVGYGHPYPALWSYPWRHAGPRWVAPEPVHDAPPEPPASRPDPSPSPRPRPPALPPTPVRGRL